MIDLRSADRRSASARRTARRSARSPRAAVRVDDELVSDPALIIAVGNDPVKLSLGKKKHGLLVG